MGTSNKLVLFVVILCACALTVSAFNFGVSISPESQSVKKGQLAAFNVTIHDDSKNKETFTIYSPDVQWDVPATTIDVDPGGSVVVPIQIKQYIDNLNPGYYLVNIHVRPNSQDQVIRTTALVSLLAEGQFNYMPSLRITPTLPAHIDPRQPANLLVDINNLNQLPVNDITLKVRSNLVNIDVKATADPLKKNTVTIPIAFNANTLKQDDTLLVSAFVNIYNKTYEFDAEPVSFDIIEYGEISAASADQGGWVKSTKTITFTNTGNADKTQTFRFDRPFFTSWFQSTDPAARLLKETDGNFYAWDISLPVGGTTAVVITTDWTVLYVILGVVIVLFLIYYVTRSPVLVEKNAVVIGTREGGLTDIKVLIEVRNRSGKVLKNVKLLDKIPRIVELIEEHGAGTLRPHKVIRQDHSGTLLSWSVNDLDKYEERVVSYRIRTKLSIVGRLHLPVSVAKFESRPGRTRSTKSNISQIGFGQ